MHINKRSGKGDAETHYFLKLSLGYPCGHGLVLFGRWVNIMLKKCYHNVHLLTDPPIAITSCIPESRYVLFTSPSQLVGRLEGILHLR